MPALLFAIGNPLRRDDGAALETVMLLGPQPHTEVRVVHQLTPECAYELQAAHADTAIFADASIESDTVRVEPAAPAGDGPALGHHLTPSQLVALARSLYAWQGEAFVCHIPARDFEHGEGLSDATRAHVVEAAGVIARLLNGRRT